MYLTFDPVRLLRDIRLIQERLVEIADKPDGSTATDGEALPLEVFLSGLRIAWRGGEVKPTARSKPAAKRERRRPNPLLAVTAEIERMVRGGPLANALATISVCRAALRQIFIRRCTVRMSSVGIHAGGPLDPFKIVGQSSPADHICFATFIFCVD